MKTRLHALLVIIGTALCISFISSINASAQEVAGSNEYPEGTIEVPEGTDISIGEDEDTVTIRNCPVEIKEGDTFIVYLQDLPVGFKARSVSEDDGALVIETEKADPSVYMLLDEEGDVELSAGMYEFEPANNVSYAVAGGSSDDYFDVDKDVTYKDGTLLMKISMGGSEISATLSNMHIGHQADNGNVSVSLSGDWRIKTTQALSDDQMADIPLGEMRIKGIGKITLSFSLTKSMSLECEMAGTFNVGVGATQEGEGSASRGFTVTEKSINGKGEMSASLKMTAGVDVLIAAADLYVDIGVETDYERKTTIDPDSNETTVCDNFRFYLFSTIGAEAKYYSIVTGKMASLPSKELWKIGGANSQYKIDLHFENGQLVDHCTKGMTIPETEHGGFDVNFSGTIQSDGRDRILESSIELPWDMTIDQDLTLSDGTLDLNGHTLTIEGDLIQSGGTLVIGEGVLNVKGDYRLQSRMEDGYGDSSGSLIVNSSEGMINIEGDMIIQSTADDHGLNTGTINIKGNIEQINPEEKASEFNTDSTCNINLTEDNLHRISFEDAENNSIGWLTLQNNAIVQSDIRLGRIDLNGHMLTVNGNMRSSGRIDLQDRDPEPEVFTVSDDFILSDNLVIESGTRFRGMNLSGHQLTVNGDMVSTSDIDLEGGTLKITGTLYQQDGTMTVNTGKLDIGGNYYLAGEGSNFETGHEVYRPASSYLDMVNASDEVFIGGDFLVASDVTASDLTAGTMYIGGNFRQVSERIISFSASGSHKVVFNGNSRQSIQFDSTDSGFNLVSFENPDVVIKGNYLRGFTMCEDMTLIIESGELNMSGEMELNGYALLINGDLVSTSEIDLGGGELNITGTLYQQYGKMEVNGGKLDIGGNYYLAGAGSRFEEGHESYKGADSYLDMLNTNDEVRVGGDFLVASYYASSGLTAGTMYIGGDFREVFIDGFNSDNFNASGSHKVVLNGNEIQYVTFDSTSSHFNILELTRSRSNYVFNSEPCWITLIEPEAPEFGTPDFVLPASLAVISEEAFESSGMNVVYIPDTCTEIRDHAFRNSETKKIRIPTNCVLGEGVFDGCSGVMIFGTKGSAAQDYCSTHENCVFVEE